MNATGMKAVEFSMSGAHRPLLVLGPSLGTSVSALWEDAAKLLVDRFDVIGWDLPGHGISQPAPAALESSPLSIADLARDVLEIVDQVQLIRGDEGGSFFYAGVSVAGCVGLELMLAHPERIIAAGLICTGARIGNASAWQDRAELVRSAGTPSQISSSAQRWFTPGFTGRNQPRSSALLHSLRVADRMGYAAVCMALAGFDLRSQLGRITSRVLVLAGAQDEATPPAVQVELAEGIPGAQLASLPETAHLAPAEQPEKVANALLDFFGVPEAADSYQTGLKIRREVLGDAHVDQAFSAAGDFGADFQALITAYAWGGIWARPGLDRRARSMITLTALTANGHWDELGMHIRAARGNGLSWQEIKEVLMQCSIYCSVPHANNAFKIAGRIHQEEHEEEQEEEKGEV